MNPKLSRSIFTLLSENWHGEGETKLTLDSRDVHFTKYTYSKHTGLTIRTKGPLSKGRLTKSFQANRTPLVAVHGDLEISELPHYHFKVYFPKCYRTFFGNDEEYSIPLALLYSDFYDYKARLNPINIETELYTKLECIYSDFHRFFENGNSYQPVEVNVSNDSLTTITSHQSSTKSSVGSFGDANVWFEYSHQYYSYDGYEYHWFPIGKVVLVPNTPKCAEWYSDQMVVLNDLILLLSNPHLMPTLTTLEGKVHYFEQAEQHYQHYPHVLMNLTHIGDGTWNHDYHLLTTLEGINEYLPIIFSNYFNKHEQLAPLIDTILYHEKQVARFLIPELLYYIIAFEAYYNSINPKPLRYCNHDTSIKIRRLLTSSLGGVQLPQVICQKLKSKLKYFDIYTLKDAMLEFHSQLPEEYHMRITTKPEMLYGQICDIRNMYVHNYRKLQNVEYCYIGLINQLRAFLYSIIFQELEIPERVGAWLIQKKCTRSGYAIH